MEKRYTQLIQTKLCLPKLRSRVVSRRRLVEQITAEPNIALNLVSAPAGYGKTTFLVELSQALGQSGAAIAWYALDPSDNDPNLFASYLVAALAEALQIEPSLAPVARLLRSSTEFSLEKTLPTIINAVASHDQACLLVFDDYHFITSPAVHSALAFLLDHLPRNLRVIVGSRSDPPLPLARLRARGQIVELRAVDLRFTPAEAAQFLRETMRLDLPLEVINDIEARTEGWAAGLQLAALSVTGRKDSAAFVSRLGGSNRYLVEYLLQEVVEQQPPEIQRFLLATSPLERLCAPLCDAILGGQSGSAAILRRLEQENLFIVPLDDEGYWYRYHQLFRDFLRTRLKQSQPDQVPLLHRAASEWYASQQLLREAVSHALEHALETHDWSYAADVVEQHGMAMFNRSEISILYQWCESFPEEAFSTHPLLCILQGWTLALSYRNENRPRVEERLRQAEQFASALENAQRRQWLTAQAALVRLCLCLMPNLTTDPQPVLALAQSTLDLLPADDSGRSLAISAIGYAHLACQNVPLAWKTMEEYRNSALAGGFYYGAVAATFHLANLAYYQGQFERARELCRQVQASIAAVMAEPEQALPAVGSLDIAQGCVLLEENRLDEAEQALLHGLDLIGWTSNPYTRMIACAALFRLREIQGRAVEAIQFLDDIEGAWPDIAFYTQGLRLTHFIRTAPEHSSTLARAESWCQQFSGSFAENLPLPGIGPFGGAQAYYGASLVWVQAQLLLGKPEQTLAYLARQQSIAEAQGLRYRLIELSLAEAQVRKALGKDQQSFQLLERALELASTIGCPRVFDQGPALARLLQAAVRRGISPVYLAQIVPVIGGSSSLGTEQRESPVRSGLAVAGLKSYLEPLSARELEVLHLLANGASNQAMADQLVVTVGTIKSHVNHIFGKLDVHNRLEAVARARELGLLTI